MNHCSLISSYLGKCIGWVPDWLVPLLPYWWVAAVLILGGLAYRVAGLPGLAAFFTAVGFILGRRSVKTEAQYPHPDIKPVGKKKGLWK